MDKEIIYVLLLQDDCWYVGKTTDLQKRIDQHMNGDGALWTRIHRPIEVASSQKKVGYWDEDNKVKSLMLNYGIEKVRGGSYVLPELPEYQILALKTEFKHVCNQCFKCGKEGHYVTNCSEAIPKKD
jgi:predicted GIY-YIG superfamily endonuclease